MSITPHRDAFAATIAEARRRRAADPGIDPVKAVLRRMSVDSNEAVMIGFAELLDLQVPQAAAAGMVNRVLAGSLASLAMTLCGCDEATANALVDVLVHDLVEQTRARIGAARTDGIVVDVVRPTVEGQA